MKDYMLSLHYALPISSFKLENLKETFKRLKMDKSYYSFNGKVKEHSMFLETINNEESKVYFLGKEGEIVSTSLVLERSEEHTSELQSRGQLVCRLLLE